LTGDVTAADDLVQDCLERALSRWRLWRPGTNLRAWLFTIMRNLWINEHQRRKARPPLASLDEVAEPGMPPQQGDRLALRDLGSALAALPDEQREVVLLVGLEGMSYAEVAEVTGVPLGTVMSRLKRGRDRLAQLISGEPVLRRVK
jgi:RNA polymerase sigma-70 factor (ECF subfamily)